MPRVRYMTKERIIKLHIYHNTDLFAFPNAGPNPSVIGMKNLFWGKNALLVRHGQYVYNVTSRPDVYYFAT